MLGNIPDLVVYKKPFATEDEKFEMREEDSYPNPLPATSEPFKSLQPELVASVTKCMEQTGNARKRFETFVDDIAPPDYQLFSAEDAMVCLLN